MVGDLDVNETTYGLLAEKAPTMRVCIWYVLFIYEIDKTGPRSRTQGDLRLPRDEGRAELARAPGIEEGTVTVSMCETRQRSHASSVCHS